VPPFSGFWSKDEILANVFHAGEVNSAFTVLWVLGVLTAFMTAFYMFRLWFMTFGGKKKEDKSKKPSALQGKGAKSPDGRSTGKSWHADAHESPYVMTVPLVILAFFAFSSGLAIFFTQSFENYIFFEHSHAIAPFDILEHTFTSWLTYVSILAAVGGISLAYLMYQRGSINPASFTSSGATRFIHKMLSKRYWMNDAYNYIGYGIYYRLARAVDWFDRKIIDGFVNGVAKSGLAVGKAHDYFDRKAVDGTVNGLSLSAIGGGRSLRKKHRGYVQDYAAMIILGVAIVIFLISIVFPLLGVK
jgi:NADH-quinone oxidoreductase subunit L